LDSRPPPGYGGIEQVVELLSLELVRRGHEVTMYAAPGSRSPADIKSPLAESHPDEIQQAIYDEREMADAVGRLHEIDPAHCREETARRFDVAAVTEAHERVYARLSRSRSATSATESVL
jgi:hypothetical protein